MRAFVSDRVPSVCPALGRPALLLDERLLLTVQLNGGPQLGEADGPADQKALQGIKSKGFGEYLLFFGLDALADRAGAQRLGHMDDGNQKIDQMRPVGDGVDQRTVDFQDIDGKVQ